MFHLNIFSFIFLILISRSRSSQQHYNGELMPIAKSYVSYFRGTAKTKCNNVNKDTWTIQSSNDLCVKDRSSRFWIHKNSSTMLCPTTAASYRSEWSCNDKKEELYMQMNENYELLAKFNSSLFINNLKTHNAKLIFIGDSTTEEMFFNLRCMVESDDYKLLADFHKYVLFFHSKILEDNSKYQIFSFNNSKISSNEWISNVTSITERKILVMNTGAWFVPERTFPKNSRVSLASNRDDILTVYLAHFLEGSPLNKALRNLINNHNATIIWRDTAPAGTCGLNGEYITGPSGRYSYYKYFFEFNSIAKSFIHSIGGFYLPLIWDATKPRWASHISGMDQLHYCLYRSSTAPWMWNTILHNYLENKIYKENCL